MATRRRALDLLGLTVSPCGVPGAAPPRRQLGRGRRIQVHRVEAAWRCLETLERETPEHVFRTCQVMCGCGLLSESAQTDR